MISTTDPLRVKTGVLASLLCAHALAGCSENPQRLIEYRDVGELCIERSSETAADNLEIGIRVVFDACASACTEELESQCTATIESTGLSVSSYASVAKPSGGGDCSTQCQVISARCGVQSRLATPFDIIHGKTRLKVQEIANLAC